MISVISVRQVVFVAAVQARSIFQLVHCIESGRILNLVLFWKDGVVLVLFKKETKVCVFVRAQKRIFLQANVLFFVRCLYVGTP